MPVRTGHTAAAARQDLQRQAKTLEHLLPEINAGRFIGALGAVRQKMENLCPALLLQRWECRHQPFLSQCDSRGRLLLKRLGVLLPVDEGHCRVQPHQRDAKFLKCL
ncbi:hypothetical protein D3C84_1095650 [compost metagenome]